MRAPWSFETSGVTEPKKQRQIPEHRNSQQYRCDNQKSCIVARSFLQHRKKTTQDKLELLISMFDDDDDASILS